MKTAPAFQFYAKDWIADEIVQLMTLGERGAYISLLAHQWLQGDIPDDVGLLARICRTTTRDMRKVWPGVAPCFPLVADGRRANARMERDRAAAEEFRRTRAEVGKKGAERRWAGHSSGNGSGNGSGIAEPMPGDGPPSASSTSSPSAPASPTAGRNGGGPKAAPPANPLLAPSDLEARRLEGYRLVRLISAATGQFPEDVLATAAAYEGDAGRQKLSLEPQAMTDSRLLATVRDLRAEWALVVKERPEVAAQLEAADPPKVMATARPA